MTKRKEWYKVKWSGNDDMPYANWECWKYGNITLYPGDDHSKGWSYVSSFGPNSDRSHSGFLAGISDLADAKKYIEQHYDEVTWK